jgi:hypothetical protein
MGQLQRVRGDEQVNIRHGAAADVRVDEGRKLGTFQHSDLDAGVLQGSQDLREVVVEEGVTGGVFEKGLAQNVEDGGGRFPRRFGDDGRWGFGMATRGRRGGRTRQKREITIKRKLRRARGNRRDVLFYNRRREACATGCEAVIKEGGEAVTGGLGDKALPVGFVCAAGDGATSEEIKEQR